MTMAYPKMPFGKFKGYPLNELPGWYVKFLRQQDFVRSPLREQLACLQPEQPATPPWDDDTGNKRQALLSELIRQQRADQKTDRMLTRFRKRRPPTKGFSPGRRPTRQDDPQKAAFLKSLR
jgi:hypothetical protein